MSQMCTADTHVSIHGQGHSDLKHGLTTVEIYEASLAVHFPSTTGV
jgi:hypothetical protein